MVVGTFLDKVGSSHFKWTIPAGMFFMFYCILMSLNACILLSHVFSSILEFRGLYSDPDWRERQELINRMSIEAQKLDKRIVRATQISSLSFSLGIFCIGSYIIANMK